MTGYRVSIRLRRAGADAATEHVLALSDKMLARLGRGTLLALGVLLLLAAPFAMTALTRPERGDRRMPWSSVEEWN